MPSRLSWRWLLPRFDIYRQCIWTDDCEATGLTIAMVWGPLVIEHFVGRIDRTFEHHALKDNQ